MKYLSVLIMLFFQCCIANPIPEFYRIQYISWGDGVHNGRFQTALEESEVISFYKKNSDIYILRGSPNGVKNLYKMVDDSEEFIVSTLHGDYLVDLYEEGDVFSILLKHANGYSVVVFEYLLDGYEQKMTTVIYNLKMITEGKDVSI